MSARAACVAGRSAREEAYPCRYGSSGRFPRKMFDLEGVRRCILKPSEDNVYAFFAGENFVIF